MNNKVYMALGITVVMAIVSIALLPFGKIIGAIILLVGLSGTIGKLSGGSK